jgi:hypothetical protein
MGAKRYGRSRQREKRLLIFDTEKYRYQKVHLGHRWHGYPRPWR